MDYERSRIDKLDERREAGEPHYQGYGLSKGDDMAQTTKTETNCDRCGRLISSDPGTPKDNSPREPALTMAMETGAEPVMFEDLCDKCVERCAKLMEAVRCSGVAK